MTSRFSVIHGQFRETAVSINLTNDSMEQFQPEKCPKKSIYLTSVDCSYGAIDIFYDIAQQICRKMQAKLDDNYLQVLTNITTIETTGDIIDSAKNFLYNNPWACLLLFSAFGFTLLLPISGLFVFCRSKKREHTNSSQILSFGYLLFLISVQTIMIGSLLLSLESIDNTINNTNNIDKIVKNITSDITNVQDVVLDNLKCEIKLTLVELFDRMRYVLWELPANVFHLYKATDGYKNIQSVANNLENIIYALNETVESAEKLSCEIRNLPLHLQSKVANLTVINNNIISCTRKMSENSKDAQCKMNDTWSNLDHAVFNSEEMNNILQEGNALIDDAGNQTVKVIEVISNGSDIVTKFVKYSNHKVDTIHRQYTEFQEYIDVGNILYLLLITPTLIVIIPTIILAFCGMARLFVSVSFATGYGLETFCLSVFNDPDMRLISALPLFRFNVENPIETFTLNIGSVMKRCKEDKTILSVLKFERLMNADAIMKQINIDSLQKKGTDAIRAIDFKQYFPKELFNKLVENSENLRNINRKLQNITIPDEVAKLNDSLCVSFNSMKNNVSNLIEILSYSINSTNQVIEYLYSSEITNQIIELFAEGFNSIVVNVTDYIQDSMNYLLENSYSCRPLYDIWEGTSTILSHKISRPLQGLWMSTGLLALSFIPVIIFTSRIVSVKSYWLKRILTFRSKAWLLHDTFVCFSTPVVFTPVVWPF
uniref:Uncharacterized protein n=1 Tax=Setaria digitata TaxID=48799 RepID=A0A915Q4Q9_9BILA